MNYNKLKYLIHGFFLTNIYGYRIQKAKYSHEKKNIRLSYSKTLFSKLNIDIIVENPEKLPLEGQYLIFSNHRSILDPLIIDIVLQSTPIFGLWVAKKELYNSLLFGKAVRNGGCIRLDRKSHDTNTFMLDIKQGLAKGNSICIFPEGTRNCSASSLLPFKNGLRIISLKHKLPMLPIYIKNNSSQLLNDALLSNKKNRELIITIGEIIEYNTKINIENAYRTMFNLS